MNDCRVKYTPTTSYYNACLFFISREFAGKSLLLQNTRQSKQSVVEISGRDFAEAGQKTPSGKIIKENQLCDFETSCSEPGIQQVNVCCSTAKCDQHSQSSHVPAAQNKQRYEAFLRFLRSREYA